MAEQPKTGYSASRVAGRYEVLGRLASGPHGPTYRALDHLWPGTSDDEREVALAILRTPAAEAPDLDQRLKELSEGLRELADEAIVAPRDCGRTELGLAYVSYEILRGIALDEWLRTEGALAEEAARALVARLAQALEQAHAHGYVHGALGPEHVHVIDGRDGRHPRLVGVGLAGLLGTGSSPPVPEDDVRALGRLLAAALAGEPGARTSAPPVDPATARIAEEAQTGGFQDMSALRTALGAPALGQTQHGLEREVLLAQSLPERLPPPESGTEVLVRPGPSRRPLFFLSLLLALGAGAAAWLARGALGAERASAAHERELAQRAQREQELEAELTAARAALAARAEPAELEAERARLGERIAELDGELAAAREEAQTLRSSQGMAALAQAESQREREAERTRLALLTEERDRALVLLSALEEEEARRLDATAHLAEAVQERFSAGDPRAVWSLLETLQADGRISSELSREPFLAAWTEAADLGRRGASAPGAESAALLAQASEALERARAEQDVFVLALRQELGPRETLEAALDSALAALELELEEQGKVRDSARLWEWNALRAAPLDAEPAAALALASSFSEDRTSELFGALELSLAERFERGSELSVEELRAAPDLGPWLAATLSAEPGRATRRIARFAWAQAWGTPALDALFARSPPPELDETCAPGTWQAALVTEALLLHRDGPYPGRPGRRALYRTLTADGAIGWQVETLAERPSGEAWTTEQSFYDADGRFLGTRELRLVRRDRTLLEEGVRPRILLRASQRWRTSAIWSAPADEPPFRLPIAPDAIAAFRARTASAPLLVLVCAEENATSLWSADVGLVRHDEPGVVTRELYFSD